MTATLFPTDAPAYTGSFVTIWHGKAEHILPRLPTESVDLVVTDPPYGDSFESNRRADGFGTIRNDGAGDRVLIARIIGECVRLVGQNRHLYVFGPADVVAGQKVSAPVELVWDKAIMSGGDLASPWGPAHEPVTFCTSKHRHAGETGREALPARIRKGTVLRFTRPTGRTVRHPNEKPVALLRELIESSSRQGDLVLDPFAGSGSTGVAAALLGRRALLVEEDPRWLDLAVSRARATEALVDQLDQL